MFHLNDKQYKIFDLMEDKNGLSQIFNGYIQLRYDSVNIMCRVYSGSNCIHSVDIKDAAKEMEKDIEHYIKLFESHNLTKEQAIQAVCENWKNDMIVL